MGGWWWRLTALARWDSEDAGWPVFQRSTLPFLVLDAVFLPRGHALGRCNAHTCASRAA